MDEESPVEEMDDGEVSVWGTILFTPEQFIEFERRIRAYLNQDDDVKR
jgi:hypothetical protein